jgi:hypothetical protein
MESYRVCVYDSWESTWRNRYIIMTIWFRQRISCWKWNRESFWSRSSMIKRRRMILPSSIGSLPWRLTCEVIEFSKSWYPKRNAGYASKSIVVNSPKWMYIGNDRMNWYF